MKDRVISAVGSLLDAAGVVAVWGSTGGTKPAGVYVLADILPGTPDRLGVARRSVHSGVISLRVVSSAGRGTYDAARDAAAIAALFPETLILALSPSGSLTLTSPGAVGPELPSEDGRIVNPVSALYMIIA